jgi:octaheme c-type cytochrome (tetrathionate reductase family)
MLLQARRSFRSLLPLMGLLLCLAGAAGATTEVHEEAAAEDAHALPAIMPLTVVKSDSTADHSKFKELKHAFDSGPEVTKACLSCHTEAGKHVMATKHWTWEFKNPKTGQTLGKKHLVNTFCTNARGNEGMCAQCHVGYGWKDESFDFSKEENIDCLVCHDRTGTYYKTPNSAGNKACAVMFEGKKAIDWQHVAQNVGLPGRENCGACHFYGGGGDGVKHGDLDSSLRLPKKALDVHMDAEGLNFACTECHKSDKHDIAGSRYDMQAKDTAGTGKPGEQRHAASCESCHGNGPHDMDLTGLKLNDHVAKVACQTCHIPSFARGGVATKTSWDWRTAGKTKNGEGYKEHGYIQGNGEDRAVYKSIKGSFQWGENLTPHYAWFNGVMDYTTIDSKFDPAKGPVEVNRLVGEPGAADARIWPFKRMQTVQPYDKGNNTLVYMHLWGEDDNSYWGNYDFGRAIRTGMEKNNLPYSGEYGFVETYSYWPITHMVAPKHDAVRCAECHSKDGRLEGIGGVYLPGRDSGNLLDVLGISLVMLTFLGVLGHAFIRVCCNKAKRGHA